MSVRSATRAKTPAFVLGWFGGAAVGAATAVVTRAVRRSRSSRRRHLPAGAEHARLRADERRRLAGELLDVVTHQLSNISLLVMGHLDSTEAGDLRDVLGRVNRSANSALSEMRVLVRVLRDHPSTWSVTDGVGDLARRTAPTVSAADWQRRLLEAGFEPVIDVPVQADGLESTVQATIARALDVTCENILQHAAPGSRCTVSVRVSPTHVVVRAVSSLSSSGLESVPLGSGLQGLRERVDLTGGGFSAGPSTSLPGAREWLVVVRMPLD